MTFEASIESFMNKAKENCRYTFHGTALEMHDRIVERTPFDTGRARTSWNIIDGEDPDLTTTPALKASVDGRGNFEFPAAGAHALTKEQANLVAKSYQLNISYTANQITISNNLEYAPGLEDGSISQQGSHMLETTVSEFVSIVAQMAAGVPV